jgi:hypothetical protein
MLQKNYLQIFRQEDPKKMEDPLQNARALQRTWKNSPKADDPFSKGNKPLPTNKVLWQSKFQFRTLPLTQESLADWWNQAYFQALGFLRNNGNELTFKSLSSK